MARKRFNHAARRPSKRNGPVVWVAVLVALGGAGAALFLVVTRGASPIPSGEALGDPNVVTDLGRRLQKHFMTEDEIVEQESRRRVADFAASRARCGDSLSDQDIARFLEFTKAQVRAERATLARARTLAEKIRAEEEAKRSCGLAPLFDVVTPRVLARVQSLGERGMLDTGKDSDMWIEILFRQEIAAAEAEARADAVMRERSR